METTETTDSFISNLIDLLALPFLTRSKPKVTPLATRYPSRPRYDELTFVTIPTLKPNATTAEKIIYNSSCERLKDEVFPRGARRYGIRPRGVILRVKNPPAWTKLPQAKAILREMNYQGLFNKTIDRAYRVHPKISMFQDKYFELYTCAPT